MSAKNKRIPAAPRQRVHANAAGIDVGSDAHVVAVPADRDAQPLRTFGVFTADLRAPRRARSRRRKFPNHP